MTEITFIQDYRGVLTDETYYLSGTVAQLPDGQAAELVKAGRAEYVKKAAPKRKRAPRRKAANG